MSLVEIETLRRSFGDVVALDGISLSLEEGEFVSLLGPSRLRQDDRPAHRRRLRPPRPRAASSSTGKDMTRVPPNKRDMGMVFQAYSLFPNMTASRNVEYGLRIRGTARRSGRPRSRSCSSSSASGTPASAIRTSSPAGCSSGSRSRGRSRSSRASLLLDEPLSALDAKVRVQLREEIRRIQQPARDHDDLRHARPGGGALDLRPGRGALAGTHRADRGAGRDLRLALDAVRGRVRRDDEPARGNGRRLAGGRGRLRRGSARGRRGSRSQRRRARARPRPAGDGRAGPGVERLPHSRAR